MRMGIGAIVFKVCDFISRGFNRVILCNIHKSRMNHVGKEVRIGRFSEFYGAENISIGSDVSLGEHTLIMCTRAKVLIGDHVMFGPHVTLITGSHRTNLIGRYMTSITNEEKESKNDQDITFDGDNWVGANATILKGVHIGRGAIIAACAVVTHDVDPYCIVGGNPARLIRKRFSDYEIEEHERILSDIQK